MSEDADVYHVGPSLRCGCLRLHPPPCLVSLLPPAVGCCMVTAPQRHVHTLRLYPFAGTCCGHGCVSWHVTGYSACSMAYAIRIPQGSSQAGAQQAARRLSAPLPPAVGHCHRGPGRSAAAGKQGERCACRCKGMAAGERWCCNRPAERVEGSALVLQQQGGCGQRCPASPWQHCAAAWHLRPGPMNLHQSVVHLLGLLQGGPTAHLYNSDNEPLFRWVVEVMPCRKRFNWDG